MPSRLPRFMKRIAPSLSILFVLPILLFITGCPQSVETSPEDDWGSVYRYPQLTDNDFLEKTRQGVYLIDFDAEWCIWCRRMDPHLAAVSDLWKDGLTIAKIDFDRNPEARSFFGVQGIPALFVLVDGKIVRKADGYQDEKQLRALVEDILLERELNEAQKNVPEPETEKQP